jgi:hypothetical protein
MPLSSTIEKFQLLGSSELNPPAWVLTNLHRFMQKA